MRALIIGSGGQLGQALQQTIPAGWDLTAPPEAECNFTNTEDIERWLASVKPDLVFNAAAYTAVDAAEKDAAIATLVNAEAVTTGDAPRRVTDRAVLELRHDSPELATAVYLVDGIKLKAGTQLRLTAHDADTGEVLFEEDLRLLVDWD